MKSLTLALVILAASLFSLPATSFADARTEFSRAIKAMQQSDVASAIDILTGIVDSGEKVEPKNMASVYNMRGMCYAGKTENEKAIDDFTKALELDPDMAEAYGNRAFVWQAMGDEQKAKDDAAAAKRIDRKVDVPEFK